jgi:stage II sporulation protein AA (anti-sigma F factor antagonist)
MGVHLVLPGGLGHRGGEAADPLSGVGGMRSTRYQAGRVIRLHWFLRRYRLPPWPGRNVAAVIGEPPRKGIGNSRKLKWVRRRGPPSLFCEVAVIAVSDDRFAATWSGRTAVVAAAREIDLTNAESLRDALLSALNSGALGLVVDMTATTFIDSAGVTALVRASRRAAASEATVRLAATSPAVLRVLNLVGIDQLIEVHPSVAEAVASLPAPCAEPRA